MSNITLIATVGHDRRLVIDIPDSIPEGEVEIKIRPLPPMPDPDDQSREAIRARLDRAGILSKAHFAPPDARPLSPEEERRLGTLFAGARPSEELIDEDRGEY